MSFWVKREERIVRRISFLGKSISISLFVVVIAALGHFGAWSQSGITIADSFDFPISNPTATIGYDVHPDSSLSRPTCFRNVDGSSVNIINTWHSGEDWFAPAGTPVKAIANGIVKFVLQQDQGSYPGSVVIVQHLTRDGSTIYSMYGHLEWNPPVTVNQSINKGDTIGNVIYQEWNGTVNSHLHWELRTFFDGGFLCNNGYVPGPGYTWPNHPDSYGYIDPARFIIYSNTNDQVVIFENSYYRGNAMKFQSSGFFNLPSFINDKASSVAIPFGWSVRVYKHTDGAGTIYERKIFEQSDLDFSNDLFDDGTPLNDNISAIQVFVNQCPLGAIRPNSVNPSASCTIPTATLTPTLGGPTVTPYPTPTPNPNWWLLVFSKAEAPPLNVVFHIEVQWTSDFDAFRLCFDGTNCQETSATELYYTWNTYGWADGNHTLSIQYRRKSDNGDWSKALLYQEQYYLSPNRNGIAPCDGGDGAYLKSGIDCIRLTASQADLGPLGWGDRSDLVVSVLGPKQAWTFDSVNYQGFSRVINSGQTMSVGGNVSSVSIQDMPPPPPPVPTTAFTCDSQTVVLYHFDEGSGSTATDACGRVNGTIDGAVSWTTGNFGSALSFPNPPDGRGVNMGAPGIFDICPMSVEMWVQGSSNGRLAGQLGANNTGQNKWLLSMEGQKPKLEIWSAGGSQAVISSQSISDSNWHLIAFSYDCGNTGKLYLDNVLVGNLTAAGVWPSGSTTLEVGSAEGIYRFNGAIDEVRVSSAIRVPTWPLATADFTASPTSGLAPLLTYFTDQSTGTITGWDWNFGDGTSSTMESPSHFYNAPGIYTVTLTATGPGGSNIMTKTNLIQVAAPPPPTPSLAANPATVSSGQAVTVSWNGLDTTGNDWISLHLAGAPDSNYLSWQYATASFGSLTFTAPSAAGSYEFRLFRNGTKVATSNTFTVTVSPVVTNTNDSGPGSLRDVITNVAASSTITFDPTVFNTSKTIILTSGAVTISKNLTIQGPGANLVAVDGNNASTVFTITSGTVNLSGLTIQHGNAGTGSGGGIHNGGTLTISNSTLSGNSAPFGGGIENVNTLTIRNSTFSGNTSGYGGGIYNDVGGILTVSNSTFSGNSASTGGGIDNGSWLMVSNSTFFGNSASSSSLGGGGGIHSYNGTTLLLGSTIVAGNIPSTVPGPDIYTYGTVSSLGSNLIGNSSGATGFVSGDQLNVNPLLNALASNGGPTQTVSLQLGSPAIQKGNCNLGSPAAPVTTDQRGVARRTPCDVGAYESSFHIKDTIGLYNTANGEFYLSRDNVNILQHFYWGPGSTWAAITGDWDGNGVSTVGLYNTTNGEFYLTNNNSAVAQHFYWGPGGTWAAIVGDWDGNGTSTIGLYNTSNGEFYLSNDNVTVAQHFYWGPGGTWKAIVGDWDGNGTDTIGLYNTANGEFYLTNNNSTVASHFYWGPGGSWVAITGDWDGNGTSTIGLYNTANGEFYLTNNNSAVSQHFYWGPGGTWKAIVGTWGAGAGSVPPPPPQSTPNPAPTFVPKK